MIDLSTLQHERDHNRLKAWLSHWDTLTDEQVKVNFLLMLKGRRDINGEDAAGTALDMLVKSWVTDKFVP